MQYGSPDVQQVALNVAMPITDEPVAQEADEPVAQEADEPVAQEADEPVCCLYAIYVTKFT